MEGPFIDDWFLASSLCAMFYMLIHVRPCHGNVYVYMKVSNDPMFLALKGYHYYKYYSVSMVYTIYQIFTTELVIRGTSVIPGS